MPLPFRGGGPLAVEATGGTSSDPMTLTVQHAGPDSLTIIGTVNSIYYPNTINYYFDAQYSYDGVNWLNAYTAGCNPFSVFALRGLPSSTTVQFRARPVDPIYGALGWSQISATVGAPKQHYRVQLLEPGDGRIPYTFSPADATGSSKIIAIATLWYGGTQIYPTWVAVSPSTSKGGVGTAVLRRQSIVQETSPSLRLRLHRTLACRCLLSASW